jgi:hypothetical protein
LHDISSRQATGIIISGGEREPCHGEKASSFEDVGTEHPCLTECRVTALLTGLIGAAASKKAFSHHSPSGSQCGCHDGKAWFRLKKETTHVVIVKRVVEKGDTSHDARCAAVQMLTRRGAFLR